MLTSTLAAMLGAAAMNASPASSVLATLVVFIEFPLVDRSGGRVLRHKPYVIQISGAYVDSLQSDGRVIVPTR